MSDTHEEPTATTAEVQDTGENIAVDPLAHDTDSAYDQESIRTDTSLTSIHSSILAFQEENGRTYHSLSAGKYMLPNDDLEQERLDVNHNLMLLTLDGKLALCPKNETANRVLDVGTGTGIWAIDYADSHPESEVIGVDLSPIQPNFVPPNCSFEVDDVEKEWTWTKKFDFIYCRGLTGAFKDHEAIVKKCYDQLEPGGYLEMWDVSFPIQSDDGTLTPEHAMHKMSVYTIDAAANLGQPINNAPKYGDMFTRAGFEDIHHQLFKHPSNRWPQDPKFKTLGLWNCANIDRGIEGLTLALFTRGLGMTHEECLQISAQARKELKNPSIHMYWPMWCCYGRKPEAK